MRSLVRVCILSLVAVAVPMAASATTFLQFTEAGGFNAPFVLTNNGGSSTTLSATKTVTASFDTSFCLVVGCGGAVSGATYNLTLTANSTSAASLVAGEISQDFGGTLSITQGAINLLSINFSDTLSGALGGSNPVLQSSQPPDIFNGTSSVFDPAKLGQPRGFSLSFSALSGGGLGITGTSIRSGAADATGTFNASPTAVPEPTSMLLLGSGLVAVARRIRKNRQ